MSNIPKFSVVIPVYNKGEHVGRCIQSVLDQSFSFFEIILIDDCSTDNSSAEIQKFHDPRIVLLSRERNGPGPGPARNLGIGAAKSEWCAFLDADDTWEPNFLETMDQVSSTAPDDVGFLFSGFHVVRPGGYKFADMFTKKFGGDSVNIFDFPTYIETWLNVHNSPNRTSATVIKTSVLRDAGGFPEDKRGERGGDKDTWLRVIARTKAAYVPIMGMNYYSNSINMVTKNVTLERRPCIYQTINQLVSGKALKPYSGMLRALYNDEVIGYVKESLRLGKKPRGLYSGFYVRENPLKYIALLVLWVLPERLIVSFFKISQRIYRTVRPVSPPG